MNSLIQLMVRVTRTRNKQLINFRQRNSNKLIRQCYETQTT